MKKQWMMPVLVLACMLMVTACTNKNANSSDTSLMGMQDEMKTQSETMKAEYKKITADEAKAMMTDDAVILDVRTEDEFAEGHIPNAVLLPQTEIPEKAEMVLNDKEKTILIYCRSGNRSEAAAKQLINMGYTHVYDFGGINTWTGELVTDDAMDAGKDMMDKPDMEKDMTDQPENTKASMNQ